MVFMATKSFQKTFLLNEKETSALADALENSRRVDIKTNKTFKYITDPKEIHAELDSVFSNLQR